MVGRGLASVGGRALMVLALVGVCCGQTYKIYQGGTAKWCAAPLVTPPRPERSRVGVSGSATRRDFLGEGAILPGASLVCVV
jgi:hypothetical protein